MPKATATARSTRALKAIESKLQSGAEMLLYSVNAITSGSTESQGEVTVRLQHGGRVVNGVGADPDIVVASAKAYLSALNKLQSNDRARAGAGLTARWAEVRRANRGRHTQANGCADQPARPAR